MDVCETNGLEERSRVLCVASPAGYSKRVITNEQNSLAMKSRCDLSRCSIESTSSAEP